MPLRRIPKASTPNKTPPESANNASRTSSNHRPTTASVEAQRKRQKTKKQLINKQPHPSPRQKLVSEDRSSILLEIRNEPDSLESLSYDAELAKLDLESINDGGFSQVHEQRLSPEVIHERDIKAKGLLTIRSAKVRDSADFQRYVKKSRTPVSVLNEQETQLTFVNNYPSELPSESKPVTYQEPNPSTDNQAEFEHISASDIIKSTENSSEMYYNLKNHSERSRRKIQPNGSINGGSIDASPSSPKFLRQNSRKKVLHTEASIQGLGGDLNGLRNELLNAVEQNKAEKVRAILSLGIDPNSICDEKGRWPLHIACYHGLPFITKLLLDHGAEKDQPDTALERTPLHYAAATSKEVVQILLHRRVDLHAKNKFGASALHYAAGAGQADCCKILASSGCDINGKDRQKLTPLLMAARIDNTWCIDILLEYGADIHAQDVFGKTALHHAAEKSEGMQFDAAKMSATFKKLVSAGVPVDSLDHDGKTPLYYATQAGSSETVETLCELGANLTDGITLLTMSKKFPYLIPPFLDKCVSSNADNCDPESKNFYIQFDYTCLTFFPRDITDEKLHNMQHREETEAVLREMGVLHGLTRCKDTSILSHPVCESLLRLKWKKVKWYLYLDMLLFAVFLAVLTVVIFMEYEDDAPELVATNGTATSTLLESSHEKDSALREGLSKLGGALHFKRSTTERYCMDSTRNMVVWIILWVLTGILGIREMVQLVQSPLNYIVQVDNILELALVLSVALLSLAECGVESFVEARDHFAAVCLIAGWTIQVTLYGKIPVFGVYIRMFATVATNILKCMFTYLGLLFAFSLTLHFLFRTQKDFDSVGFTFLKTFAMMIGEVDLTRTFIDSREKNAVIVPFTSHIVVGLFIVFISIILTSLFFALAVCDINSMQQEGDYMQLVQQVKVASQLEDALQKRSLLYPQFGMKDIKSLHQRKGVIFPNIKDHGKLSKDAIEIVMRQHTTTRIQSHRRLGQTKQSIQHDFSSGHILDGEILEGAFQNVKDEMEKHSKQLDGKMVQIMQDVKSQSSNPVSKDIALIKSQLDDVNNSLREMNSVLNTLVEKMLKERSSSIPADSPSSSVNAVEEEIPASSPSHSIPTECTRNLELHQPAQKGEEHESSPFGKLLGPDPKKDNIDLERKSSVQSEVNRSSSSPVPLKPNEEVANTELNTE